MDIRVLYLLQKASLLLPPIDTPLTGIEFTCRLPCGDTEHTRKVHVCMCLSMYHCVCVCVQIYIVYLNSHTYMYMYLLTPSSAGYACVFCHEEAEPAASRGGRERVAFDRPTQFSLSGRHSGPQ